MNNMLLLYLQVLEGGGMEEADAWLVLRGILSALAYIHSQVRGNALRA